MKRITFVFLLFGMSLTVIRSQTNLLHNGDFESTEYEYISMAPGEPPYENNIQCPNIIPGWDIKNPTVAYNQNNVGLNIWCVRGTIETYDEPEDDNYQYLRMQRYEWDGWYDNEADREMGLTQTFNVKSATDYTLTFNYRISKRAGTANNFLPQAFFKVKENNSTTPSTIFLDNNKNETWVPITYRITTGATTTKLSVQVGVPSAPGGEHEGSLAWDSSLNYWADFDNVALVEKNENAIKDIQTGTPITAYNNGLDLYLSGLNQEKVNIYNLTGQLLCSSLIISGKVRLTMPAKGVYVVKNGTQAPLKVIVK
jgi:hypothetical protein